MFDLAFQSRRRAASQAWLEPNTHDRIRQLPAEGIHDVIIVPIGFLLEHTEVIYDLDVEAAGLCDELGST